MLVLKLFDTNSNLTDDKLCKLFERVAIKNPKNEMYLRTVWFENMIFVNDYAGQQKATMALHKLGKRQYTLWAVFSLYLAVKSGTASKTESLIFPQLASRFLEGVKPLQNAQEGYLQALVFQVRNQTKELAEFLKSEQVKTWDLLDLNVLIPSALEEAKDWEGLRDYCENYLVEKKRDDWNHWKALLNAHATLGSLKKALEIAQGYQKTRNSLLAIIELSAMEVPGSPALNEAVENYFDAFSLKRSTVPDLMKYTLLSSFDKARWIEFLSKVDSEDLVVNVNAETLKFAMREADYDLNSLVAKQVAHYEGAKGFLKTKDVKDYHPGDDYLLIASYAIMEKSHDSESLKKAAILLELAAKNDKHQFYVRLWLVRIYLLLGAYKMAKGHYMALKVCKIQNESLSHLLLTRISSILPDFDILYDVFEIYETSNGDLTQYISKAFENNAFTQLESMSDLQRIMKSSVSRGIIQNEIFKAKRFQSVQKLVGLGNLRLDNLPDNRDFDIMWDVPRQGTAPLAQRLTIGPKIGSEWIDVHQRKDNIVKSLIKGPPALKQLAADLIEAANKAQLTGAEKWSVEVIETLARSALEKNKESGYTTVSAKIKEGEALLASISTESWWLFLHTRFVIMETLIIVCGYLDLLVKGKSHIVFNQAKAGALRKNIESGLFTQAKEEVLTVKNKRPATIEDDLAKIIPWTKSLGFVDPDYQLAIAQIASNVVNGVAVSQDESLTAIRAVKI